MNIPEAGQQCVRYLAHIAHGVCRRDLGLLREADQRGQLLGNRYFADEVDTVQVTLVQQP